MAKYLHKFTSLEDFKAAYEGENYLEPWVSYTTYDEIVGFEATAQNEYGNAETMNFVLFEEVNDIDIQIAN